MSPVAAVTRRFGLAILRSGIDQGDFYAAYRADYLLWLGYRQLQSPILLFRYASEYRSLVL